MGRVRNGRGWGGGAEGAAGAAVSGVGEHYVWFLAKEEKMLRRLEEKVSKVLGRLVSG